MSAVSRRWIYCFVLFMVSGVVLAQGLTPEKVIIDTDIGDDVDDAFALALAVKSPELQVLGVMTTFGDTESRAKIAERFLAEVGRDEIPVLAGSRRPRRCLCRSGDIERIVLRRIRTETRWNSCWSRFGSIRGRLR